MDTDPKLWTPEEVQSFWKHDATTFFQNQSLYTLPPLEPLLEWLETQIINGAELLNEIRHVHIEQIYGVGSFRAIKSVMQCIGMLRQRSQTLGLTTTHDDTSMRGLPTPANHSPQISKRPLSPDSSTSTHATLENTAIDGNGHHNKRRRVQIINTVPLQEVVQPPKTSSTSVNTVVPAKLTCNDIFFGNTDIGQVINYASDHQHSDSDNTSEFDFQFYGTAHAAHSIFTNQRMKYFLSNAQRYAIIRGGQEATAIIPYPLGKTEQPCAMVYQIDEGKNVVTRENVVFTTSGMLITTHEHIANKDPLAGLMARHLDEYDETLDLDNATQDNSSDTEESMSGSDQAEEEAEEKVLPLAHVKLIALQQYIDMIIRYREKLETANSRKVWKQSRGSKALRLELIKQSRHTVQHLLHRIISQEERLLYGSYLNEGELKLSFGAVEPTVEDIEKEQWKINIWSGNEAPPAAASRSTDVTKPSRNVQGSTLDNAKDMYEQPDTAMDDFIVSDDDKPLRDRYIVIDDDIEMPDADLSPTPVAPRARIVKFPIPRSTSSNPNTTQGTSITPELARLMVRLPLPPPQPTPQTSATPAYLKSEMSNASDQSTDLPELDQILSDGKKKRQSAAASAAGEASVVIELSSDDDYSVKGDSVKGDDDDTKQDTLIPAEGIIAMKHERAMGIAVERLSAVDIEDMDKDLLARSNERQRLLLKMLYDAGNEFRSRLRTLAAGPPMNIQRRLIVALEDLQRDISGSVDDTDSQTMYGCACICMAWWLLEPEIFYKGTSPETQKIKELLGDVVQVEHFALRLHSLIKFNDNKMWPNKTSGSTKANALVISSEDEDEKGSSAKTKRRRKIKLSETAIQSRNAALVRQTKYDAVQQATSDSAALAAMVADTASNVQIEINPARQEDESPIHINRAIAERLKPHQIDGVRFLWRETTANEDNDDVRGCLLAHSMGLGKTMQTITMLLTINETARSSDDQIAKQLPDHLRPADVRFQHRHLRGMVLCPPALINNWRNEIRSWVPNHALGMVYSLDKLNKPYDRLHCLEEWSLNGGVLLMGYHMFRSLIAKSSKDTSDADDAEMTSTMLKILRNDAEIVVADEAHTFKTLGSGINKAVTSLRAKSRVALTGTPLSNSIDEVFALFNWIAPGYLGTHLEFNGRFANPIKEGVGSDSTPAQVRLSKKRLAVLQSEIEPKYLRADITVLKGMLKPKIEFLLTVSLTPQQSLAYSKFVHFLQGKAGQQDIARVTLFAWLNTLTLLTNHPWSFRNKLLTPPTVKKTKQKGNLVAAVESNAEANDAQDDDQEDVDSLDIRAYGMTSEIVQSIISGIGDDIDPCLSGKTGLFLELLLKSLHAGDKMIVFTSALSTLDYLGKLLDLHDVGYGRLDGSTKMDTRTELIKRMTANEFHVMLISTRAGGLGLNMQCANRVVIFDSNFNPTWEEQAIGRSYRLGQDKAVFVYRFIAGGTFEINLENKQLFKKALASRVVDKKDTIRQASKSIEDWLYEPRPVSEENINEWIGKDPGVLDDILKAQVVRADGGTALNHIFKIRTMETLQAESDDADLDEVERIEVATEIAQSKTRRRESARILARNNTQVLPAALTPRKTAAFRDALASSQQSVSALPQPDLASAIPPSQVQQTATDVPVESTSNPPEEAVGVATDPSLQS